MISRLLSDHHSELVLVAAIVVVIAMIVIAVMVEGEQVHEIADRRAIFGHIAVVVTLLDRVRQIVAAAIRDLGKIPVLLDEFDERDMITIFMGDVTALGVLLDDDQRDTGAIAKKSTGWMYPES